MEDVTDGVCDGVCDRVWLFGKDSFKECPLIVRGQENVKTKFNIPNQCKQGHTALFIVPTYRYCLVIQLNIA